MARFRGQIEAKSGGSAARLDEHQIAAAITGLHSGVEVRAEVRDGVDVFLLFAIGGARNPLLERRFLGVVHLQNGEVRFTVNNDALLAEEDVMKRFRVYGTAHYDAWVMVEAETPLEALKVAAQEGKNQHNVQRGDFMEFDPSDTVEEA